MPGRVRERAVGGGEECSRRLTCDGRDARQRHLVLQVFVQRVAPRFSHHAGNGVGTDVAVELLRPVAGVAAQVVPERRVLVPVLEPRLVDGEISGRLADSGDEHRAARGGQHAVSIVEAVQEGAHVHARAANALTHRRRQLVQRPAVAGSNVVARSRHAPPRLDPGRVPGVARGRDPGAPARHVDLCQSVEGGPQRADSPRLIGTRLRLVGRQRRHGDVVLHTGRCVRCELRGEAKPVGRRVEDGTQQLAVGRSMSWPLIWMAMVSMTWYLPIWQLEF